MTKATTTEIKTTETITVKEVLSDDGKTFCTFTGMVTPRNKQTDMIIQNQTVYDSNKLDAEMEYKEFCATIAETEAHTTVTNPDKEEI